MIPFWKRTVPLSFICVMGNGPINSNSCLEFSYVWLEFCHQPCIGDYFIACFLNCYFDLFAIVCVAECVPSRQHKQLRINHNNKGENMRRNNHQYKVGDKILVKRKKNSKYELEFMGPFPITLINDNGTVRFQKWIIKNATNIRRIKPFFD